MSNFKFFVYGTLKKGGLFAKEFDGRRVSVKSALARGTMYSVCGNFPAVIFSKNAQTVFGEIHEYKDEKTVSKAFDAIEGFVGKDNTRNLYNRKIITVIDARGVKVSCITYEFNRPVVNLPEVVNGIWEIKDNGNS